MYYLDAVHGKDGSEIYRVKSSFNLPLQKNRQGDFKIPDGETIHVCLTSDFFLEEADPWREEAWEIMRQRPGIRFWLQTKRIERVAALLPEDFEANFGHVAFCVTAENDARAKERLPQLMALPFREKHVMCAPLLSDIDLSPWLATGKIDGVLADGENYAGARPCHYEWVEHLYRQCAETDTPFAFVGTGNVFVKDGRRYEVPKAYQHVEALRSGLQYPPRTSVPEIQKKCAACRRKTTCNGCRHCGKCKKI